MPNTWTRALRAYHYPVSLPNYGRAGEFPGFFDRVIAGDRTSTMEFEDHFRAKSNRCIEAYFEVVFWVLCGQSKFFEGSVDRIVDHLLNTGVQAAQLRAVIDHFAIAPTTRNLTALRSLLGITSDVLTVALTFPAFVDPVRFPMVNRQTAKWVTRNLGAHNNGRRNALTAFWHPDRGLHYNNFDNYVNWIQWCRETAVTLSHRTDMEWRARDAEMAVFTAARGGLSLNAL